MFLTNFLSLVVFEGNTAVRRRFPLASQARREHAFPAPAEP